MQKYSKLILAFTAKKSNVEIHRHSAFQIVYTIDNNFKTLIENKDHNNVFGFVIRPQVAHSCLCNNSDLIVVNIEAYSILGRLIDKQLSESHSHIFSTNEEFDTFFFHLKHHSYSNFLQFLNSDMFSIHPIDDRVKKSIEYIENNFKSESVSIPEIANHVTLSASRLAALFKQQTGSSISKYLLWTRLRNAVVLILNNKNVSLTQIALESGFYDSSQMNKYMYQMFGVSPSKLRQKSELIQFLDI